MGLKLQARVVEITEKGLGVELTDISTPYPKIISDILITEHLVLKCGSPQKESSVCRLANKHNQTDTQGVPGDAVNLSGSKFVLAFTLLFNAFTYNRFSYVSFYLALTCTPYTPPSLSVGFLSQFIPLLLSLFFFNT